MAYAAETSGDGWIQLLSSFLLGMMMRVENKLWLAVHVNVTLQGLPQGFPPFARSLPGNGIQPRRQRGQPDRAPGSFTEVEACPVRHARPAVCTGRDCEIPSVRIQSRSDMLASGSHRGDLGVEGRMESRRIVWMIRFAFFCQSILSRRVCFPGTCLTCNTFDFFPRLHLLIPNALFGATPLGMYQTRTSDGSQHTKSTVPPDPPPQVFEGAVVWQANL